MAQPLLLKNVRLIDGLADQPQVGMSILVTGERISKVERGEIPAPPNAQVIDLGGKTVLPGLIDTHVHSTLMDRESLPLFLAAGVTSARDVGGMAAFKAVTSVAARYLRQQENIGSIAPGRYADLLIVDGDPLRDTRELRKLTTVYRGGKAYDPQTLLAGVPKSAVGQAH